MRRSRLPWTGSPTTIWRKVRRSGSGTAGRVLRRGEHPARYGRAARHHRGETRGGAHWTGPRALPRHPKGCRDERRD
jgi:hypothetical protein